MNRRGICNIAAVGLLLTSLGWYARAQSADVPTNRANPVVGVYADALNSTGPGQVKSYQIPALPTPPNIIRSLEQQSREIALLYRKNTDSAKRNGARDALQKTVAELFELRQKARENELDELKKEIERLQLLHDRRQKEKDRIVGDRVESLLREAEGLGWGSSSGSGNGNKNIPSLPGGRNRLR